MVVFAHELQILEADRDVLATDADKSAHMDECDDNLAVLVGDEIADLADRLILRILDRLTDQVAGKPFVIFLLIIFLLIRQ